MTNLFSIITCILFIVFTCLLVFTGTLFTSAAWYIFIYFCILSIQLRFLNDTNSVKSTSISVRFKVLLGLSAGICFGALTASVTALFINNVVVPHAFILSLITLVLLLLFAQLHTYYKNNVVLLKTQQKRMNDKCQTEKTVLEKELQENQDILEVTVQERTLELNVALQELEDVNRELAEKTTTDDLTKLYNRRFYDQRILAEFRRSRRNLSPLSLIVVDIDFFKKVNDKFGHKAGDQCLQVVAQCIKSSLLRSADIACRYGGEEFCLIMPETALSGAKSFAEELRQRIALLNINYQNQAISLTISCGISCYQQEEYMSPETLFVAADKALYKAKELGRNQVQLAELNNIEEQ